MQRDSYMWANDVAHYTRRAETLGLFDVYGASVLGPAYIASPDYRSWGVEAHANAKRSIRFHGTLREMTT